MTVPATTPPALSITFKAPRTTLRGVFPQTYGQDDRVHLASQGERVADREHRWRVDEDHIVVLARAEKHLVEGERLETYRGASLLLLLAGT